MSDALATEPHRLLNIYIYIYIYIYIRQDGIVRQGVALILNKQLIWRMINYECISSRLLKVTIELRTDRITYFVVYAPDSSYEDTYVEDIFGTLQDEINIFPPSDNIVLLGDFNASVGSHMQYIWPEVVGSYDAGEHNEIGVKLLQY